MKNPARRALPLLGLLFPMLLTLGSRVARGEELPGEGYRNHLVFSLGAGIESIASGEWNGYVDALNAQQSGAVMNPAHPSLALHVPLLATYYGPYWILARVGLEGSYFFPSETVGGQSVSSYGGVAEVPILIGGHYALLDNRLILELALGPDIAAFTSAGLNGNAVNGVQLYADPSVGFDSELKGQFFLSSGFSLGLELGYRALTSSSLHNSAGQVDLTAGKPTHIDFSGVRAIFELGFVAI